MEKLLGNKKILVGVASLLIIVLVSVVFLIIYNKKQEKVIQEKDIQEKSLPEDSAKIWEELKKITVPEPGDKIEVSEKYQESESTTSKTTSSLTQTQEQPSNVAIPEEAVPASPGESDTKSRTFNLTIKNNKIIPKEIRVYVNDIVDISVVAVDKDYDLSIPEYGLKTEIKKGKSSKIQFQAYNPGKFTLYCSLCSPEFKGLLLVKPR